VPDWLLLCRRCRDLSARELPKNLAEEIGIGVCGGFWSMDNWIVFWGLEMMRRTTFLGVAYVSPPSSRECPSWP
jgi:hypothetical protein